MSLLALLGLLRSPNILVMVRVHSSLLVSHVLTKTYRALSESSRFSLTSLCLPCSCASLPFLTLTIVLTVPLAYTISLTHSITNETVLDACFLPVVGNIVGGAIAGRVSDATVRAWRTKRKGEWMPEDWLGF